MSGHWMITATGRDHMLSGPSLLLNEIDIGEIAWSLAQINRYTGHARRPYSVAEHSLLVADLAKHDGKSATVQLAGLMHDAHEAYTNDMGTPQKHVVGLGWARFEHLQADCVRRHFGLLTAFASHRQLVNHYDTVALATERRDLIRFDPRRNLAWFIDEPGKQTPPASWVDLTADYRTATPWSVWRDSFLARYFELSREVQATADGLMKPSDAMCPGIDWPAFGAEPECLGCKRYRAPGQLATVAPNATWLTPPTQGNFPCQHRDPVWP